MDDTHHVATCTRTAVDRYRPDDLACAPGEQTRTLKIEHAARRERHDDAHRPRRIGLRPSDARYGRQRGSGGQMQEFAEGKFHLNLPSRHSITSSARPRNDPGIVRPSALAVVRFTTRSNLVGCSPGMSPGFAPRRILST